MVKYYVYFDDSSTLEYLMVDNNIIVRVFYVELGLSGIYSEISDKSILGTNVLDTSEFDSNTLKEIEYDDYISMFNMLQQYDHAWYKINQMIFNVKTS